MKASYGFYLIHFLTCNVLKITCSSIPMEYFNLNFKVFILITICLVFCLKSKTFVVTVQKICPKKLFWTKNRPLRNSSINWIILQRFLIQNHMKLPITEKRRNKAIYLTWNSIRLKFVKKTSMPNSVKSPGYTKCYRSLTLTFCRKI